MQLIVCKQLDRAAEARRERLGGEVSAGALAHPHLVERTLKRQSIQMLAAIREQLIEDLRDALVTCGGFSLRTITDVAEDTDRVAHILGLHDEGEAIRQARHDGVRRNGRNAQAAERRLRPARQLGGACLAEGDVLLSTEPAARGDRSAGALRHHDGGDRVIELEVLTGHSIHVCDGDLLDSRQVFGR